MVVNIADVNWLKVITRLLSFRHLHQARA